MARPRSDIRPRILAAARARFLNEGVEGSSLRRIAQDAGTNIGMIYYYFPNKDDLFQGVVEEIYAGLLEDLSVALADDAGVEVRLERLFLRVAHLSEDEFDVIRIVIREALVSSDRLGRVVERVSHGHLPLVISMLLEGVRDGTLSRRLPLPALLAAVGSMVVTPQLVRRLLDSQGVPLPLPGPDELAQALRDALMNGIVNENKP